MSALPEATISSACFGFRDQADRDGGEPGRLPDRLRERHLVAGAERNFLQRRNAARGRVDPVDAALFQFLREFDGLRQIPAALDPVGARTRAMPTGLSCGNAARTASNTSSGKRMRFCKRAAILIGALVGDRRQELMQQIAVRGVHLDGVDAEPLGALGGRHERVAHALRAPPRRTPAAASRPPCAESPKGPPAASRLRRPGSIARRPTACGSRPCGRHGRAASSRRPSSACAPRPGSASARLRWRRCRGRGSPA